MAKQPDPYKRLSTEIAKLREVVRRLQNRSPFFNTGISLVAPGQFVIDGDVTITGNLHAQAKIDNAALTDPLVPAVVHAQAVDFTVPTTNTVRATATVPVPSGYTRAIVTAHAHASCYNPNAVSDYLFVVAWIESDTTIGYAMPQGVPPNDSATTAQTATALLTDLTGSFTVKCAVSSQFSAFNTSTSGNVCNIDATVLFLR